MLEFDYKLENVQRFTLQAFHYNKTKKFEESLQCSRKCCEAICRAILLRNFGESLGKEIIEGKKDKNGNQKTPIHGTSNYKIPLLNELIRFVTHLPNVKPEIVTRLNDIKRGGNPASHDPLSKADEVTEENASFCISTLRRILEWFYQDYLSLSLPDAMVNAFNDKIDYELLVESEDESWNKLFIESDFFKNHQNYILIAPPSFNDLNQSQLSALAKIQWSIIFDFNPYSKSNGLYNAFSSILKNQEIKPISIEQKDSLEVTSGTRYIINWVFANGLDGLPDTIGKDKRDWKINLKYGQFIKKIIGEVFNRKIQKFTVICLWDEIAFVREIIDTLSENSVPANVKYIIVYDDDTKLPRLKDEFDWTNPILIHSTYAKIIQGIQSSLFVKSTLSNSLKQVPTRVDDGEEEYLDISDSYLKFLDADFEVLYLAIEQDISVNLDEKPFFKGNTIRWDELSKEIDVRREKRNSLTEKVNSLLVATKGAYVIELSHKPGSGGTTLARRIAFDFHKQYPAALISKFHREKTSEEIFRLANLTQKPLLLVIEAHQITKNELNSIIRRVNLDKKHVVILYVKRVFKNISNENSKQVFLSDMLLTSSERDRFIGKYEQITPKQNLPKILEFNSKIPSDCEVFDFSLTAFEDDYSSQSLKKYLKYYIDKLPANQLQFLGFCSLVYFYTQKSLSSSIFIKLFPDMNLEEELSLKPLEEHFIRKLLSHTFNVTNFEHEDRWRPRYSRFAKEIMEIVFSTDENWKDSVSKWVIDLIELLKTDTYYLTEDIKDLYKSLILNRDNEELLGIDDEYQYIPFRKFSKLIEDISDRENKQAVFKKLVESYPDEAHYHGHLGRFLFENAKIPEDFENAEAEILKSIELGDTDFNLWHLKGMCSRRRIEYLIRSYDESNYSADEIIEFEEIIKDLTEIAIDDFTRSREINPSNLHSHTAQIQLTLSVVQFGQQLSNTSIEGFLVDTSNYWYEKLINQVFELIDEAKYIIELSKDIEYLKERKKAKNMIDSSEGKLFTIMGDFSQAVDKFMQLSKTADRTIRPYFRKMYVYSILNSKVSKNYKNINSAWSKLSEYEFEKIVESLENNIREEPANTHNIRLWLRALRNYPQTKSLDDVLSIIKTWYDNTLDNRIAHTEATYYRYILHSCRALSAGKSFSSLDVDEAKRFINECKDLAQNDRYSFEWYSSGKGIKTIINHASLGSMSTESGFFIDTSLLKETEGIITNIYNRQQGKIRLECGIEAFFVPAKGGFEKGDETTKVSFYISFRYSGLHAWEVRELGETVKVYSSNQELEIEDYDKPEEEPEDIDAKILTEKENKQKVEPIYKDTPNLEGVKIVGKIDLTQFEKYKKKKR